MGRQGVIRTMTTDGGIAARGLLEGLLVVSFVAHGKSRTSEGLLLGRQGIIRTMTTDGGIAARDLSEGLMVSLCSCGCLRSTSLDRILRLVLPLYLGSRSIDVLCVEASPL